jgi:hypothetical protein
MTPHDVTVDALIGHDCHVMRARITRTLGDWFAKAPTEEEALSESQTAGIAALEREWGAEARARIAPAQRTAEAACERFPWLADLLATGAANNPNLMRLFSELGLRSARQSKR